MEIITFMRSEEVIQSNFDTTNKFLSNIGTPTIKGEFYNDLHKWKNIYLWKDIDPKNVIVFLKDYKRFIEARTMETAQFAKYIENLNTFNELTNWTICLHGSGSSKVKKRFADKYDTELILRKPSNQRNEKKISLKVVTQSVDELIGLEGSEIDNYKSVSKTLQKSIILTLMKKVYFKREGI